MRQRFKQILVVELRRTGRVHTLRKLGMGTLKYCRPYFTHHEMVLVGDQVASGHDVLILGFDEFT